MRCLSMLMGAAFLSAGLLGCQSGSPILHELPDPYVQGRAVRPPRPARPAPTPVARRGKSLSSTTIVIDPGHGGQDNGTWPKRTSKLPEKAIVLDIGNRVSRLLRDRGARVVSTRTTDVKISLDRRARIAESNRADLFVSIHADYASRSSASGISIFIYKKASSQSKAAARQMVSAVKSAGISCRGIQPRNLHVLREHSRPAMLIECGFLSNAQEGRKLNTPAYRAKVAAAIADGIARHFGG